MTDDNLHAAMTALADECGPPRSDLYAAAVHTARRTTRRRAMAAVAVLTLLGSVGAAAALGLGPDRRADPGATDPASTHSAPVVRTDLMRKGSTVAVPAGAIDLANATVDLPPLGYPVPRCAGAVRFSAYENKEDGRTIQITKEWSADVDHDGTVDTLAMVVCERGGRRDWQVVAVTPAGGGLRTIGQVLSIGPRPAPAVLFDLGVVADGLVSVEVGDWLGGGGEDAARVSTHQARSYRWDGSRFTQVGGDTRFPPNRNLFDLELTSASLVLGPVAGSNRPATLTITGRNDGPGAAHQIEVLFGYPTFAVPGDGGWQRCTQSGSADGVHGASCPIDDLSAGDSFTLALELTVPAGVRASDFPAALSVDLVGHDRMGYGYVLDVTLPNHRQIVVAMD